MPNDIDALDTPAILHAKRLMSGDKVSEGEAHLIMAGLLLSVEKLSRTFERFERSLWSEDKLRAIIAGEVERHCAARAAARSPCAVPDRVQAPPSGGVAAWIGRLLRGLLFAK
jgi:hypothetical protein